ncbi:MAG: hypothetical protein JSR44_16605 [Spirochaetes bacterium]|nr:hypothetical protein [Spirochaetota bacterium]
MQVQATQKLGVVGQRGQITLDSKLAGRSVRITKIDQGRYLVEEVSVIPASETWAHSAKNKKIIAKGIESLQKLGKKSIRHAAEIDIFLKNVR